MSNMMNKAILDSKSFHTRITRTLEGGAHVDLSTESCKRFLKRNVGKRINVVVLYVDVDGSTRMSLQLSDRQFARIIQVFAQERAWLSLIIKDMYSNMLEMRSLPCSPCGIMRKRCVRMQYIARKP
jgi:hypothetical protein